MPIQVLPEGRYLPEREGHRVWWCETGFPADVPVLIVHGGPGGRTRLAPFTWFDGLPVRCIAFDQRGCGQSLPAGALEHNHLTGLLDDIERLRIELGLAAWAIVAGSWGAVPALAYAAAHPRRVKGLFLRSAFLGSDAEVARFFEPWAAWLGSAGAAWLGADRVADPLALLHADGGAARVGGGVSPSRVALAWQAFEQAQARAGGLRATPDEGFKPPESAPPAQPDSLPASLSVQLHFLREHCFVRPSLVDQWVGSLATALAACPVVLVHGTADEVCHPQVSAGLAARWPHASLRWVDGAGHDMDAPALRNALTEAAHQWVARLVPQRA